MASTLSSIGALGGHHRPRLGPDMRLHSVGASSLLRRGFLTPPHKKELPILKYHNSARDRALFASSASSGTGDKDLPVEAGPYHFPAWARGVIACLAAGVAAAAALMKFGGIFLVSTGDFQFRPLRPGGMSLIKFHFLVAQSQTPPAICLSRPGRLSRPSFFFLCPGVTPIPK